MWIHRDRVFSIIVLLLASLPLTTRAAVIDYQFTASNITVEPVSGDSVVADLLIASAANADIHGRFSYASELAQAEVSSSIFSFSGNAWGVSFDLSQTFLSVYRSTLPIWYPNRTDAISIGGYIPGELQESFDGYTLRVVQLQYQQPTPWLDDNFGGVAPGNLSLLEGTPASLEMCFSAASGAYSCVFIHDISTAMTAVPIPASGSMLLAALCGLIVRRRY